MRNSPPFPKEPVPWPTWLLKLARWLFVIGVIGVVLIVTLVMNVHWAIKPKDEKLDAARAAASRPVPNSAQVRPAAAPAHTRK
ncbi:hypothetical protein Q5H92_05695 [Hymenobacter sp. M29]|uniref:Uncharacterized protein n=1 Tax=Hymenobacter mellowenesis TaxID=3063995 RepID=A0ABT9AA26_9BACT|nr:hypothetical protein [Hymenobacter sp. M29]MDO7845841.1 hypothetical protein [Hymenobacter sp. M29]